MLLFFTYTCWVFCFSLLSFCFACISCSELLDFVLHLSLIQSYYFSAWCVMLVNIGCHIFKSQMPYRNITHNIFLELCQYVITTIYLFILQGGHLVLWSGERTWLFIVHLCWPLSGLCFTWCLVDVQNVETDRDLKRSKGGVEESLYCKEW